MKVILNAAPKREFQIDILIIRHYRHFKIYSNGEKKLTQLTKATQLNMMRNVCIMDWQQGLSFILGMETSKLSASLELRDCNPSSTGNVNCNLTLWLFMSKFEKLTMGN